MIRCIQYERMTIKIFQHHENSNIETATKDMLNNIRQTDLDTKKPRFQRASGAHRRQVYEELDKFKPISRLRASDPKLLLPVVSNGASHTQVVNKLKGVIETTMIRRSASSNLPNAKGGPTSLSSLFKKIYRRTAKVSRRPDDEYEYQSFHPMAI